MLLGEVVNSVTHSDSSKTTSLPCVNLLGVSKKKKEEVIKQTYEQFVRYGREATVWVTLSTSSRLFQFVLKHTSKITFLTPRIKYQNKRYDAILLSFLKW